MCSADHPFEDVEQFCSPQAPSSTQEGISACMGWVTGPSWEAASMGPSVSPCLPAWGCVCLSEVFWLAADRHKSKETGREHPAFGPVLCMWAV